MRSSLGVVASVGEEAPLEAGITEGHGEEHHAGDDDMHVVQRPKAKFLELAERPLLLLLLAREVEDVEPVGRCHAVVEPAVSADDAVGEGEEEGEGGEDSDQCGRDHLLTGWHVPWLVKDGDSAWYATTVPVGRSCPRFTALDITLSATVRSAAMVGEPSSAPFCTVGGALSLV